MSKLCERSQWLLHYLYRRYPLGHAKINALPCDAPMGIDMTNVRGLERAGLVKERSGVITITEDGILWCNDDLAGRL